MTPHQLFSLDGKVALITGGATGIGRMAATGLMQAGAHVFIASRKQGACETVALLEWKRLAKKLLNAQTHSTY